MVFWKMCWSHKLQPFSTRVVLYSKHLLIPQQFSNHCKGRVEAGQGAHHLFIEDVPLYGKAHQEKAHKTEEGGRQRMPFT